MTLHDGALGLLLVSLSAWDAATRECPRWLFLAWAGVLLGGWVAGAWPGSWLGAALGWGAARWCRWPGGDQRAGVLIGFLVGPLAWLGGLAVTLAVLLLVPVRWARWLNRWPMIPLVSVGVGGLYWFLRWYGGGSMGVNDRILTPAPIRPLTDREVSAILGALFGGCLSSGLATPETLIRALHFWQEKGLAALIAVIREARGHAEKADG